MSSDISDTSLEDVSEETVVNTVNESQQDISLTKHSQAIGISMKKSGPKRGKKKIRLETMQLPSSPVTLFEETIQRPKKIQSMERFEAYRKSIEEKIQMKRKHKEEEEARDCTFTPSINKSSERYRSFEEQYESLMKFQQTKIEKMSKLREDPSVEDFDFRPKISKKSSILVQAKPYTMRQCHERLYKSHKAKWTNFEITEPSYSFIPQVNKKSREVARSKPVDDLLYEDAVRRNSSRKTSQKTSSAHISSNSLSILARKFLKEFSETIKQIDPDNNRSLNYAHFVHLFQVMNFASNESMKDTKLLLELWNTIGGKSAKVNDLKVAMMGIMGFFQPWMQKSHGFALDKEAVQHMHNKYFVLYQNKIIRRNYTHPHEKENERTREDPQERSVQTVINTINRVREAKNSITSLSVTVNFRNDTAELLIDNKQDPSKTVSEFAVLNGLSDDEHLELKQIIEGIVFNK